MHKALDAYKPAASARTQMLLAAVMWTVVGAALAVFGGRWVWAAHVRYGPPLLVLAVAAGMLKAHFVLSRTARRMIDRIRQRGDGRCIGGFLSVRTWGFVVLMMGLGYVLRHGLLPRTIVGLIYVGVGTALLVASRRIWVAWYRHRSDCT